MKWSMGKMIKAVACFYTERLMKICDLETESDFY